MNLLAALRSSLDGGGSAVEVVLHAYSRRKRGRKPSMSYRGERNPVKALLLALSDIHVTDLAELQKSVLEAIVLAQFFARIVGWRAIVCTFAGTKVRVAACIPTAELFEQWQEKVLDAFRLSGFDNPYGRFPAPVVPVGIVANNYLATLYPAGGQRLDFPPRGVRYMCFSPEQLSTLNFDPRTERLFAYDAEHVTSYRVADEQKFFAKVLADPGFCQKDPDMWMMLLERTIEGK